MKTLMEKFLQAEIDGCRERHTCTNSTVEETIDFIEDFPRFLKELQNV